MLDKVRLLHIADRRLSYFDSFTCDKIRLGKKSNSLLQTELSLPWLHHRTWIRIGKFPFGRKES